MEREIFVQAWNMVQKYRDITQEDNWDPVIEDYRKLFNLGGEFARNMAVTVLKYIEERSKRPRNVEE